MGYIYLLHFDQPISKKHTCQHYLGYTSRRITIRIQEHRKGMRSAARLTQVAKERGIGFRVVRTWRGTRNDERRLKNRKSGNDLCPVCQGKGIRNYLNRYNKEDTNATNQSV